MADIKVGIQIQPQATSVEEMRAAWRTADEIGADSIWVWDHFYPLYGDPDATHFEGWTLLAAMATDTKNAMIGTLVTGNSYRNPELLADMARTVDHISDGRLILGIGAGWFERDYDEYGYDFGTPGSRLKALSESLPAIEDRMSKLNPPPTRKIPVLIGGGGERKTLQYAARHADVWHFWWGEEWAHKNEVLERWCADVDRDPTSIRRSVGIDTDKVEDFDALFSGLATANVHEITLGTGGPDYKMDHMKRFIDWRDSL